MPKPTHLRFNDKAIWDGGKKTAISIRDGVLEYLGAEIGMEPIDKVFTVYRSPATIASAAIKMNGIPLTNEHVELDAPPSDIIGSISGAEVIDYFEDGTDSRLAVKNIIDIKSELLDTLDTGKKELSLGYNANLTPHTKYDFEQRDIEPHHLAVVHAGRCGSGCKFLDRKGHIMTQHEAFCDADGMINLAQVVEIAMALPEAIKTLSLDQLKEIMPKLQEIVASAQAGEIRTDTQEVPGDNMAGGETPAESDNYMDGDAMTPEEEAKKKADEAAVEQNATDAEEDMTPEELAKKKEEEKAKEGKKQAARDASFKDAIDKAVSEKIAIIEKAKTFCDTVDSTKSNLEIMRAAIATEHKDVEFSDAEVAVAFKLLKKTPKQYKDFADNKGKSGFASLAGKTLKGDK